MPRRHPVKKPRLSNEEVEERALVATVDRLQILIEFVARKELSKARASLLVEEAKLKSACAVSGTSFSQSTFASGAFGDFSAYPANFDGLLPTTLADPFTPSAIDSLSGRSNIALSPESSYSGGFPITPLQPWAQPSPQFYQPGTMLTPDIFYHRSANQVNVTLGDALDLSPCSNTARFPAADAENMQMDLMN